jgi:hypothetical protein
VKTIGIDRLLVKSSLSPMEVAQWLNDHDKHPRGEIFHVISRGVRIFDSANSNFEKVEKFDSNSNWQIGIRFARIVVVQNSFMNNSKARSNIRE